MEFPDPTTGVLNSDFVICADVHTQTSRSCFLRRIPRDPDGKCKIFSFLLPWAAGPNRTARVSSAKALHGSQI